MNSSARRVALLVVALMVLLATLVTLRGRRSPRFLEPGARASAATSGSMRDPTGIAVPPPESGVRELAGAITSTQSSVAIPPEPGGFAQARFVDELGNPIAGVELALQTPAAATRSGANGIARLELEPGTLAPGRTLTFEARHPGFARDLRAANGVASGRLLLGDWRLVAGGAVEGRVVDEGGLGVAGARVACARGDLTEADWGREARLGLDALARSGARATSAADGSFRLDEVPAGRNRLVALAADRPAARSEPVEVPPGGLASGVRIELAPADGGTRITGIVLDPERRAVPLAHLVVREGKTELRARAGSDGRFEILCADFALRDLIALDPEQRRREAVRLGVRPGTSGVELQLAPAPEVDVRVRSESGAPVERYALAVLAAERSLPLAFFPAAERPAGLARIAAPGQTFLVEVRADGFRPTRSAPFAAEAPPERIELSLTPAGGIRGRVTAAGASVAGARVSLHAAVERRTTYNGFPLRLHPEPVADTESDGDGAFALTVPEPGRYHLLVDADGFASAERGPFPLAPDGVLEEHVELDAGGRLEVRVHAGDPASAAGVLVAFSRGDGGAFTERTDESGRIALELLTPGPWQVERAEAEIDPSFGATQLGRREAEPVPSNCVVHAGETTRVELWLDEEPEHACRLSGRLVLDGAPAAGFLAGLDREGRVVIDRQPFEEPGLFRLGLDEPGEYRLRLTCDTDDPSAMLVLCETLELREGERHWSLELTTGALEGTLAVGAEPALVFHRWRRGALECLAPLVPDEDGRFRCARVPAGPGALVRYDPARALEEQTPEVLRELTVERGRTTRIEL
jgi:carboxypeptidase family protein